MKGSWTGVPFIDVMAAPVIKQAGRISNELNKIMGAFNP